MKKVTRRSFFKTSATAAAGFSVARSVLSSGVVGANDDIRVGVVGFGGQGGGHINEFQGIEGVRVVALCDVDRDILNNKVRELDEQGVKVDAYTDVRKLLENKNIDAISIATPNHWHALCAIWACQAGKDVYVEKPVSHNVWEGRKIVEAARKYNRIVQTGTQKRSDEGLQEVFDYIQKGNLGKMLVSRGFCYKRRASIGKVSGPQPVPAAVDYNLWTGPAPLGPLLRERLHYDWHWVWPTGSGDLGNQGIHEMDLARWATGQQALPPRVMSIGGRFGYDDDGTTANTQIGVLAYEPAPVIFEVRGLPQKTGQEAMDNYRGTRIGVSVECENGYFVGGGGGGWVYDNEGNRVKQFVGSGGGNHYRNFIKAVRSRKVSDLTADILKGHLSSALCHMANVSHRLGQRVSPDKVREAIGDNPLILEAFERFEKHLKANDVDASKEGIVLGPWLTMDPGTERFTGAGEYSVTRWANDLLTRDYREPFVVPENV